MNLTTEQQAIVDAVKAGHQIVVAQAGAGAGKSTTLCAVAQAFGSDVRGVFVAFNKSIVADIGGKLPSNFRAATSHSIAFRAVGADFAHRLNAPRMSNRDLVRNLGIEGPIYLGGKVLQPGTQARLVMKAATAFCYSDDAEPQARHFPYVDGIDEPNGYGERTYANNREVAATLLPYLRRAWHDLQNKEGQLPFSHDVYLKLWCMNPTLAASVILLDEAQDSNPALIGALRKLVKQGKRLVVVGDSQQQIMAWRGAVDAMAAFEGSQHMLTHSFRFGPAIAEQANRILDKLPTQLRMTGAGPQDGQVDACASPDAILCRTNAKAIATALTAQAAGTKVHVVGGASDVAGFARGAAELMETGWTAHFELTIFRSWGEVQSYVEDGDGDDLAALVRLVDEFGTDTILACLDSAVSETQADLVVSTAHKAKGREWDAVRLADDFVSDLDALTQEELRLLYVAVTRAKRHLDLTHMATEKKSRRVAANYREISGFGRNSPQAQRTTCRYQ